MKIILSEILFCLFVCSLTTFSFYISFLEPKKFCDFRRIKNMRLKTSDINHANIESISECRELCLTSRIGCKSYEYESDLRICRLSHLSELTSSHIAEPYLHQDRSVTYELSTCYNGMIIMIYIRYD